MGAYEQDACTLYRPVQTDDRQTRKMCIESRTHTHARMHTHTHMHTCTHIVRETLAVHETPTGGSIHMQECITHLVRHLFIQYIIIVITNVVEIGEWVLH